MKNISITIALAITLFHIKPVQVQDNSNMSLARSNDGDLKVVKDAVFRL